jgi:hypothetical protein
MPWHGICLIIECPAPGRCAGNGTGILLIAITAVAICGPSLDVGPIFSSAARRIVYQGQIAGARAPATDGFNPEILP